MRDQNHANRFPVTRSTKVCSSYRTVWIQVKSHFHSVHRSLFGLFTATVNGSNSVFKINDVSTVCTDILRTVSCYYDRFYCKLLLNSKITASEIIILWIFHATYMSRHSADYNTHAKVKDSMSLRNESRSPDGPVFPIVMIITLYFYYSILLLPYNAIMLGTVFPL